MNDFNATWFLWGVTTGLIIAFIPYLIGASLL